MPFLFQLLVYVLIAGVIFGIVQWIINQTPAMQPFKWVANVILGIMAIIFLIWVGQTVIGHSGKWW